LTRLSSNEFKKLRELRKATIQDRVKRAAQPVRNQYLTPSEDESDDRSYVSVRHPLCEAPPTLINSSPLGPKSGRLRALQTDSGPRSISTGSPFTTSDPQTPMPGSPFSMIQSEYSPETVFSRFESPEVVISTPFTVSPPKQPNTGPSGVKKRVHGGNQRRVSKPAQLSPANQVRIGSRQGRNNEKRNANSSADAVKQHRKRCLQGGHFEEKLSRVRNWRRS
jgi:hypothetical protein